MKKSPWLWQSLLDSLTSYHPDTISVQRLCFVSRFYHFCISFLWLLCISFPWLFCISFLWLFCISFLWPLLKLFIPPFHYFRRSFPVQCFLRRNRSNTPNSEYRLVIMTSLTSSKSKELEDMLKVFQKHYKDNILAPVHTRCMERFLC